MLRAEGLLSDGARKELEASVAAEIAHAVAVAEAGPWEPIEDLTRDVYTPVLAS
jgi:pyruvate dehydrogenase E1 component alpha subunit